MTAMADSLTISRIEADIVPSGIVQTNRYLRGANPHGHAIRMAMMGRLKYGLQPSGDPGRVASYQGIGAGYLLNSRMLGSPVEAFIFHGAPIVRLSPRLSLNYELQLGGSFGWKNTGSELKDNHVLGSKANFYLGTDLHLCWQFSRQWDLSLGGSYMHFSNGNLAMPNEGLNDVGVRLSAAYYPERSERASRATLVSARSVPKDERWTTDILLYGGWKKKSQLRPDGFGVAGFSVSPTYRLNEAIAIGAALDGVYDRSVNIADLADHTSASPTTDRQTALGLQARAELTMPVLRISAGAGYFVLGGFHAPYETIAVKADVSQRMFVHLGYCLYNYRLPNNLMLGVGCRLGKHHRE
jgi:hypothetical protein